MMFNQRKLELKTEEIYKSTKPLISSNLCLISYPKNVGSYNATIESSIGEYPKNSFRVDKPRKLFRINTSLNDSKFSRQKLDSDKRAASNFDPSKVIFSNVQQFKRRPLLYEKTPDLVNPQKFQNFYLCDRGVISFQIMELRTRKRVVQGFLSIYELLESLDCLKRVSWIKYSHLDFIYSAEMDTFVVEMKLNLSYLTHPADIQMINPGEDQKQKRPVYVNFVGEALEEGESKLRFYVTNFLRGDKREVAMVERLSPQSKSRIAKYSKGLLSFLETGSDVKFEIMSKGVTRDKVYSSSEMETPERGVMRTLSEVVKIGLNSRVLNFRKPVSFPDNGVRMVQEVNQDTLLVVGSTKLMLLDIGSGKLISSCEYNLHLPKDYDETLFDRDLLIKLADPDTLGDIEVFKLQPESEGEAPLMKLGVIDLTEFKEFRSLSEILGFRKLSENLYEGMLIVEWKVSDHHLEYYRPILFSLKFRASINNLKLPELKIIEGQRICNLNPKNYNTYKKGGQWNFISLTNKRELEFCCRNSPGVQRLSPEQGGIDLYTFNTGEIMDQGEIKSSHIHGRYVYVHTRNKQMVETNKDEIRVLEFGKIKQTGEVSTFKLVKTREVERGISSVFFDDETDLMRIFCFERQRERKKAVNLKILNQSLEQTAQIKNMGIAGVRRCVTLDENRILINFLHRVGDVSKDKWLLLNLKTKVIRRVIDQDGNGITQPLHLCSDGRLVCFSSKLISKWEKEKISDIFISE